jgi:glucose/arabinose dehydrogenase
MTAVSTRLTCPHRLVWAATLALAALAALALGPRPAAAAWNVPPSYSDQLVAGGFTFPVGFAFLPDGRMLVVEKDSARVRLVINGAIAANDPLVRVPNVRFAGFEQGLLGVAVDPGFPSRPYFYVHYDYALSSNIRVSRYTVAGDLDFTGNGELTCDPASRYDVLTDLIDVNDHHNGGTLRFGPDGMLYEQRAESRARPRRHPANRRVAAAGGGRRTACQGADHAGGQSVRRVARSRSTADVDLRHAQSVPVHHRSDRRCPVRR